MPGGLQSPGSGAPSSDSWDSQNPGSPAGLTGKVLRGFDPTRETLTRYYERLSKQRAALETLGMPLVEGVYEGLRERAAIQSEVFTSSGPDPERFVRHLKRLFAMDYLDIDGTAEQMSRLDAMTSLMTDRSVDVEALRAQITAGVQAVAPSPAGPALNASPPRRPDSRERRLEAAGFGSAREPERFDISTPPRGSKRAGRNPDIWLYNRKPRPNPGGGNQKLAGGKRKSTADPENPQASRKPPPKPQGRDGNTKYSKPEKRQGNRKG